MTTEARRWAKFPATILFITGFIWLLQVIFRFDINQVGDQSEKVIGAIGVFFNLALVPLGSMVVALALLFTQRWSYLPSVLLPIYPLIATTITLAGKVQRKFAEYRTQGIESSFGDGVMTALLIIALWLLFVLMCAYIWKSWMLLKRDQEWLTKPLPDGDHKADGEAHVKQIENERSAEDFDPLFPIVESGSDTED